MTYVKRFQELTVYKKAMELQYDIYRLTKGFPSEEKFSLTSQILRSSRAIGSQIAESWGKRRYEKHFITKLTDSDSEQLETQHWLATALQCSYIKQETYYDLMIRLEEIGNMLHSMINKSSSFCQPGH